jgi:hypothetical protein
MWNPVPVDIGFDLSFIRLNTAFAGTANLGALGTVFQSSALGRSSGIYNIDNQNVYSAMFRIQRNSPQRDGSPPAEKAGGLFVCGRLVRAGLYYRDNEEYLIEITWFFKISHF